MLVSYIDNLIWNLFQAKSCLLSRDSTIYCFYKLQYGLYCVLTGIYVAVHSLSFQASTMKRALYTVTDCLCSWMVSPWCSFWRAKSQDLNSMLKNL